MIGSMIVNRPVIIRRGVLTPAAGGPEQSPPGNGATITIYDQTLDTNGLGAAPCPFSRLVLTVFSSHDSAASGVVFAESEDGTNVRTVSSQTYTAANGLSTFDYLCRGGHPKVTYQNSANALTSWEYTLTGVQGDRNPGS